MAKVGNCCIAHLVVNPAAKAKVGNCCRLSGNLLAKPTKEEEQGIDLFAIRS